MGQAFCEYIESRREDTVTDAGGVAATVVVTMGLDALLGGPAAASLDTGGKISAGEARRIACRACRMEKSRSRSRWPGGC